MHCLTSLQQIQGPAARPFLEEALRTATTDTVAKHCRFLLDQIGVTTVATPAPASGPPRPANTK
jgi:hypothetical protein